MSLQPTQTAGFNGGAPLSPTQIQQIRTQSGITSPTGGSAPTTGSPSGASDPWAAFDTAVKGKHATPVAGATPSSPNYLQRVSSDLAARNAEMGKGVQEGAAAYQANLQHPSASGELNAAGGLVHAGTHMVGETAGGVLDSLMELPGVKQGFGAINDAGKTVSDEFMKHPMYAYLFDKYVGFEDKHPFLADAPGDALNVLGLVGAPEGAAKFGDTVKSAPHDLATTARTAGDTAKSVGGATLNLVKPAAKAPIEAARSALTKLPVDVENVVKNAPNPGAIKSELKGYLETGKASIESGGKELSPYEQAGRDYLSAGLKKLHEDLQTHGQAKEDALSTFGDKKADIAPTVDTFHALMDRVLGTKYNGIDAAGDATGLTFEEHLQKLHRALEGDHVSLDDNLFTDAPGRLSKLETTGDKALIAKTHEMLTNFMDNGGSARQLDDLISKLDQNVKYQQSSKPNPVNTPAQGVVKQVIHSLRDQLESMGEDQETGANPFKEAKGNYAERIRFKNDLEKRLGGQVGSEGDYKNTASLLIRRLSPQDSGTRHVLREFERLTGVPIFQHSVMAKFAMDILKDNRVRSVLENISKTAKDAQGGSGIIKSIWNTAVHALTDPEGKAMKILDERIGADGTKGIYDAVKDWYKDQTTGSSEQSK